MHRSRKRSHEGKKRRGRHIRTVMSFTSEKVGQSHCFLTWSVSKPPGSKFTSIYATLEGGAQTSVSFSLLYTIRECLMVEMADSLEADRANNYPSQVSAESLSPISGMREGRRKQVTVKRKISNQVALRPHPNSPPALALPLDSQTSP